MWHEGGESFAGDAIYEPTFVMFPPGNPLENPTFPRDSVRNWDGTARFRHQKTVTRSAPVSESRTGSSGLSGDAPSRRMPERVLQTLITGPGWIDEVVDWNGLYPGDRDKMRLTIELAKQNVLRRTGGPFGAAIFDRASGRLVSIGVNSVVRLNNSASHAEMLAIMFAQARLGSYTLQDSGLDHELVTSCDPCAMCLGAALWSGVRRLVAGAGRDDAAAIDFDEGPVFAESYAYLESRGITITRGVLRAEAAAILELYREQGGPIRR